MGKIGYLNCTCKKILNEKPTTFLWIKKTGEKQHLSTISTFFIFSLPQPFLSPSIYMAHIQTGRQAGRERKHNWIARPHSSEIRVQQMAWTGSFLLYSVWLRLQIPVQATREHHSNNLREGDRERPESLLHPWFDLIYSFWAAYGSFFGFNWIGVNPINGSIKPLGGSNFELPRPLIEWFTGMSHPVFLAEMYVTGQNLLKLKG